MRRSRLVGALLILLGLSGTALPIEPAAQPIHGQVQFDHALVSGDVVLRAGQGSLLIQGVPRSLDIGAPAVELTLVSVTIEHLNNPAAGDVAVKMDERRETRRLHDAHVALTEASDASVLFAFSNDSATDRFTLPLGRVNGELLNATTSPVDVWIGHAGQPYSFEHSVNAPAFGVGQGGLDAPYHTRTSEVRAEGDFAVVLDNVVFTVSSAEGSEIIQTGEHVIEQTRAPSFPVRYRTERTYAVLELSDASLAVEPGSAETRFLSRNPVYEVAGRATFFANQALLTLNQTRSTLSNGTLLVAGNLTLRPTGTLGSSGLPLSQNQARSTARLSGNATLVAMNGRLLTLDLPEAVRSASLLAMLVGLIVTAWAAIQKVAAPFLFPLYARLVRTDILNHKHRARLHQEIRAHPFLHLRELERRLGMGYGCTVYHLSIMKKEGLVSCIALHKDLYYVTTPGFSHASMRRLATLAEPGREHVARVVASMGECTQPDLRRRTGLTKGAVSKILARLSDAGLLETVGTKPLKYAPTALLLGWFASSAPTAPVALEAQRAHA